MSNNQSIENGLKEVLESYSAMGPESPSSFMLIEDLTSSCWAKCCAACHADMAYFESVKWDRMITAVPDSSPDALAYIAMLIDGPFRGFSDLICLNKDLDSGLYYLELTNLDKWPANVLFNFCIASRVPIEWTDLLPYWEGLVSKGYNSTLAFLISASNRGRPFQKTRLWAYPNHMWLDAASDWGTILSGSPNMTCKSYKSSPFDCTPTNKIWGRSVDHVRLIHASDEQIADYFDLPPVPPKPKRLRSGRSVKELIFNMGAPAPLGGHQPNPILEVNAGVFAAQWAHAQDAINPPPPQPVPVAPQPFADWDFPDDPDVDDQDDDDHDPFDDFHEDIDDNDF